MLGFEDLPRFSIPSALLEELCEGKPVKVTAWAWSSRQCLKLLEGRGAVASSQCQVRARRRSYVLRRSAVGRRELRQGFSPGPGQPQRRGVPETSPPGKSLSKLGCGPFRESLLERDRRALWWNPAQECHLWKEANLPRLGLSQSLKGRAHVTSARKAACKGALGGDRIAQRKLMPAPGGNETSQVNDDFRAIGKAL